MGPLAELLSSGHQQTFDFFVAGLSDVSEPSVSRQELLYNASILAHYAQTSTSSGSGLPAAATLATLFDQFVLSSDMQYDAAMMESAAAQCLLLAGFFEEQSSRRHNISWYSQLGASFFVRASRQESSAPKAAFLLILARQFEPWRQRHARLGRELMAQPYLLSLPRAV